MRWRGSPSGAEFSYNDYDNRRTNSNVSAQLFNSITGHAHMAKNHKLKEALVALSNVTQLKQGMKRIGNLYYQITDFDNLRQADANARKGKKHQPGVKLFDQNPEGKLLLIQESLFNKTFQTAEYATFLVYEPKERLIFKLPYYPDRIVHHAIMNVLKQYFHAWFTADTYANIEGRGIHAASDAVKSSLKDIAGTQYCLKLDIRKYYPNINHDVLKTMIRRKIKDQELLWLLDGIIEPVKVAKWIDENFNNDKAFIIVSGVKFTLFAPSKFVRMITITKE